MSIFKKNSADQISGSWNYYSIRKVLENPINHDDQISVMHDLSKESGEEYFRKHMNLVRTLMSREMVGNLIQLFLPEAEAIQDDLDIDKDIAEIASLLTYGYSFAMTEDLFGISKSSEISGACRNGLLMMAQAYIMENPGEEKLILTCLYRGYEICRNRVK